MTNECLTFYVADFRSDIPQMDYDFDQMAWSEPHEYQSPQTLEELLARQDMERRAASDPTNEVLADMLFNMNFKKADK